MAFDDFESSREQGTPVELYDLRLGSQAYFLTSSEESIVVEAQTWQPANVKRSELSISPEERTEVVEVSLPSTHPFVREFINIIPGQKGTLTIHRYHHLDDLEDSGALHVIFKGVVKSVAFSNDGFEATVAVMPLTDVLNRSIPRFTYRGLCNHILYDSGCQVPEAAFRFTGNVSDHDGRNITVDGINVQGDGWATGGFVSAGAGEFRLINSQVGDVITVLMPFPPNFNLEGQNIDVQAGCDHTPGTCKAKFDNIINYGGFPFVPTKNPFQTGLD